jgi:hypothetical protein
MDGYDSGAHRRDRAPDAHDVKRSLDYLRKRSQHRLWWSSARIALGRAGNGARVDTFEAPPRSKPR